MSSLKQLIRQNRGQIDNQAARRMTGLFARTTLNVNINVSQMTQARYGGWDPERQSHFVRTPSGGVKHGKWISNGAAGVGDLISAMPSGTGATFDTMPR
jgi:hypothetical protein